MKKGCLFLLALALIAGTLSACSSQLFIQGIQPAAVAIDNQQWKVVLLNRFNPALLPFERERKLDVYTTGASYAFLGALEAILSDSTYLLVHTDSAVYLPLSPNAPLDTAQVAELYAQHPHHLILALENIELFFHQETDREKDEDGNVSKTAHYTLITRTHWALYDSTARILDRATMEENAFYQSRAVISGLLAVGPSLSKAGELVNPLAWDSGFNYWKRLSPQEVSYFRPYYSMNKLEPAAALMARQEWEAAIELLKPMAESNTKDAAKAAYNLAVIYEAMGNLEELRYWAQQAKNKNSRLAQAHYPTY